MHYAYKHVEGLVCVVSHVRISLLMIQYTHISALGVTCNAKRFHDDWGEHEGDSCTRMPQYQGLRRE